MSSGQEEISESPVAEILIEENLDEDSNLVEIAEQVVETEVEVDTLEEVDEEVVDRQIDEEEQIRENLNDERGGRITPKTNRELKSILELSKEAKLDTNIGHKRKSIEPGGKQVEKSESLVKRRYSTGSNSDSSKGDKKLIKLQNVELQSSVSDNEDQETKEKDGSSCISNKINKRKRDNLPESNIGGAVDEYGKRSRKLSATNLIVTMNNKKKDPFCWRCHHDGSMVFCETCPRSFHSKCLRQNVAQAVRWLCPECVTILKAENLKQRSPAMRDMSLVHLCGLLKFALKRMEQVVGCEPFIHPVSDKDFPDYKNYIVQPMDLTCLEKNIKDNVYGSTQAFEADAKWVLHNSIIFNSLFPDQSKLTSTAKSMLKICKQEMAEIENCANCYLNANSKPDTWFIEVCPKPHLLVWAKLKGFPYWPAKAMRSNLQGYVDVRFFGAHDRAWVPSKECFLFSLKDPNSSKVKRNDINKSVQELKIHIENLKKVYGEFHYAPYQVVFEPDQELEHLQMMLPTYDPNAKFPPKLVQKHSTNGTTSPNDIDPDHDSDNERNSNLSKDETEKLAGDSEQDDEMELTINQIMINKSKCEEVQTGKINQSSSLSKSDLDDNEDVYSSMLEDTNVFGNRTVRGGKVRMRGGYTNTSGKIKIIPKLTPESESKKRLSCEELEMPGKLSRRNSTKSNSSRLSNMSDKMNKLDTSENMEITLVGNNASASELSKVDLSDLVAFESKCKPIIQVNIATNANAEFEISPRNKSRIADRLMKKLQEPLDDIDDDKVESEKKQVSNDTNSFSSLNQNITETDLLLEKIKDKGLTVLEKITELSPDTEIFEISPQMQVSKTKAISNSTGENSDETDEKIITSETRFLTVKEINKVIFTPEQSEDNVTVSFTNPEQSSCDSLETTSSDDDSPQSSSDTSSKKGESVISSNTSSDKSDSLHVSNEKETESKDISSVTSISEQNKEVSEQSSNKSNNNVDGCTSGSAKDDKREITVLQVIPSNKVVQTPIFRIEKATITSINKNNDSVQPNILSRQLPILQERQKRKRSSGSDEIEEINPFQKKLVKMVNIDDIKNKSLEDNAFISSSKTKQSPNNASIVVNRLNITDTDSVSPNQNCSPEKELAKDVPNYIAENDISSVVIKSEPSSEDDEPCDSEYMELKRKYLSALNISEKMPDKPKQNEIRTRSKTEEKKFKTVDNLSKVIDQVATHYSAEHANEEVILRQAAKKKEIFIKPLAKLQMPKQRARKSFPMPLPAVRNVYPAVKRDTLRLSKSISTPIISASPLKSTLGNVALASKPLETFSNAGNIMFLATPTVTNSLTVLPPNQPITYTANMGNPMLTMLQHPIGTAVNSVYIQQTNLATPPVVGSNCVAGQPETVTEGLESQNYIPQSGACTKTATSKPSAVINGENVTSVSSVPALAPLSSQNTATSNGTTIEGNSGRSQEVMDELLTLSSCVPESLTKAISDLMCHAPPKLKPRPPGPLSTHFDEGLPSCAGTVISTVNSISHRLSDYLRGMLMELLQELGTPAHPEAELIKAKLENEELKYKHSEEILEIKKNVSTILKDIQKSVADERNRLVDETRSGCEAECLKRVEEAKSKQWCANCSKEAQFYCCWNTSYCDYPCQQKHWPIHMSKCTQNMQNSQQLPTSSCGSSTTGNKQLQPLVLRQTTAPKGFTKALIAKPTKVFVNRSGNSKGSFNVVRTTSGSHITLVEATPGNYELVGNGGPISIGGKFITSMGKIKSTNVISVTSPSSSGSTLVTGSGQKTIVIASKPPTMVTSKLIPTPTAIISDDECE